MCRHFIAVLFLFCSCLAFGQQTPTIVGQNPVSVAEEDTRTITLSDLIIEYDDDDDDDDDEDDEELVLEVEAGTNYSVSGTSITPAVNFTGVLSVPVAVSNSGGRSNTWQLQVEVTEVNDPPAITGQVSLQTAEGQPITLTLNDLSVTDPDNVYPDDFTLTVSGGIGYSVSGSTVTPDATFVGTLSVDVSVNDGTTSSSTFPLQIEVTNVNDPPVITGQQQLAINEGESLAFDLTFLTVSDADNSYPDDFTFSLSAGTNYTLSGTTIIPDPEFSGTLTVPVTVNDGSASSDPFNLSVSVNAVNDPPVITGQVALATSEGQSLAIELTYLTVSDPDNNYPDDFTLTVSGGDNYSVSGNTITPAAGFNGTLSVPVTVSDFSDVSNSFSLQISVDAVNDVPVITGQVPLQTSEDQPITVTLQDLTVTDPDNVYPTDFSLTVSSGSNYTVSGSTITPSAGFNGTLSVSVTVSDGTSTSDPFNLQIQVNSVNNPPVITGQTALQINEEEGLTLSLSHLTVSDPDNTYPAGFTMTVYSGENYSVSGLTITPVANFNGTLSVPVTVNDGGSDSEAFNLQITVLASNDAPVITGQATLSTPEDTPLVIGLSSLLVNDSDNSFPTGFTLNISAGGNFTVSGTTITPAANFVGTLRIPVTVSDGTLLSPVFELAVEVTPVNDPPVITAQSVLSTKEETPIELQLSHLTVTDPDNIYPSGFTLSISAGANFSIEGTTITPATDFTGTLSVPVTVNDGQASSQPFNVQINVEGENDAPVITGQSALTVNEEQSLTIGLANLTVSDTDNNYPEGFTLSVGEGSNYTVSGATITPVENFNGILTVPVTANDGTSNSNTFELQVTVNAVNDVPVISGQLEISVFRDKTFTLDLTHLVVTDPDNVYPDQFALTVHEGGNYTLFENMITPASEFTGLLSVPVTVSDGTADSETFFVQIDVVPPPNVRPVITSQVALTTYENESLVLQLSHLVVADPDNRFPDDFNLNVFEGLNYTVEGTTIIPTRDYSGTLTVPVTVSDKESTSDKYNLMIQVLPVADVPLITSQQFLRMNEDDSLTLKFSDLIVIDPDDTYPNGFSMTASPGNNYTLDGLMVKPAANYNGYLSVPVTVNDGANTSTPYQVLILVDPVNDEPVISEPEPGTLFFARGKGSLKIFEKIIIEDVDDDTLSLAEIAIDPSDYEPGKDSLLYVTSPSIRTAFDRSSGLLVLFGRASLKDYESVIRSIEYNYISATDPPKATKVFSLAVNDGKVFNRAFNRVIGFEDELVSLDIPSGFTPNGDGANDTWNIKSVQGNDSFSAAVIRVYNKTGVLVFETNGREREWDGRMNGVLLPADSYFYTIDLNGSYARSRYKGIVTILR